MPTPREDESRDDFVARCMSSTEAVQDFPDRDQRFAFCNSEWERARENNRKRQPRKKPKNRRKSRPHPEWKDVRIDWKQFGAEEENVLTGIASTFGSPPDEDNDIISNGAFRKTIKERVSKGLVKLLDSHNPDTAHTLGTVIEADEREDGLFIKARLSTAPSALDAKRKMQEGHLNKLSIGFQSVKERFGRDEKTGKRVRFIDEAKLFEVSVVPIPANQNTSILMVKAVVPFQDLPLANRDREWSAEEAEFRVRSAFGGRENVDNLDFERYRRAFLWWDTEEPEQVGSYKLQIADFIDGRLVAVPRALFAVASILQGARGGVDVPEEDIERLRRQVSRYYAKMRDEFDDDQIVPPWETDAQHLPRHREEDQAGPVQEKNFHEELQTLSDEEVQRLFDITEETWEEIPINHFLGMGSVIIDEMRLRQLNIDEMSEFVQAVQEFVEREPEHAQKTGRRNSQADLEHLKEAIANLLRVLDASERDEAIKEITDMLKERSNKPKQAPTIGAEPETPKSSLTLKERKARAILLQQKLKETKGRLRDV